MNRYNQPSMQTTFLKILKRGAGCQCPHCGKGPLYHGWFRLNEKCENCRLIFEPKGGDVWGFWLIGDRLFVFAALIIFYGGMMPKDLGMTLDTLLRTGIFFVIAAGLVFTMPHRMGICLALDYLSRRKFSNPNDEFPPLGTKRPSQK